MLFRSLPNPEPHPCLPSSLPSPLALESVSFCCFTAVILEPHFASLAQGLAPGGSTSPLPNACVEDGGGGTRRPDVI